MIQYQVNHWDREQNIHESLESHPVSGQQNPEPKQNTEFHNTSIPLTQGQYQKPTRFEHWTNAGQ